MNSDKWIDEDFPIYEVVQLDSNDTRNESLSLKEAPEAPKTSEQGFFKKSFDVDTITIINRIKKTFIPLGTESLFENGAPDLYVPFWTLTTLVIIIFIVSIHLNHEIKVLITVAGVLYTLSAIIPLILSCYISNLTGVADTLEIISIHGYSYMHFIIPTIISVFAVYYVRWILWLLAVCHSLFFLKKYLWKLVSDLLVANQIVSALVVSAGHLCLVLTANLYFLVE